MKRITDRRAAERREYAKRKAAYLERHPLDQVCIAIHGFDEALLLSFPIGTNGVEHKGTFVPRANQIHHRLKSNGSRLNDERWWMATTLEWHNEVENRKAWAREHGFLLPIQADKEGRWGDGLQALTTDEFMKARAGL